MALMSASDESQRIRELQELLIRVSALSQPEALTNLQPPPPGAPCLSWWLGDKSRGPRHGPGTICAP